MHLAVLFQNIGGYHAARLRVVNEFCERMGARLSVIQVTDDCREYRWGDLQREITFELRTLLPAGDRPLDVDQGEGASAAAAALGPLLDELRPTVVAIPGWSLPFCRRALRWAKQRGAASVVMSDSKKDDRRRRWWKEQVKSHLYIRRFDAALVAGSQQKAYLQALGFAAEKIFPGYCVVDNDYFHERAEAARANPAAARQRDSRIPQRPFFLCATRLIGRKNINRLIEAYASYHAQVGPAAAFDLAICGSGEEQTAIQKLIVDRGLENSVHLPGFVSYQQIGDWYGLASAFIHPALDEPWGLVINEACAAGLPILASRTVGASDELVKENGNGFLFDPHSTDEIAATMMKVHRLDSHSRHALGEASRRIVAAFSPEVFATNLFKAIDVAIAFGKGKPVKTGSGAVVSQL